MPASVHCFTSILHATVHKGDANQSYQLVEKMRAAGVQLDSGIYNLLVTGAINGGDAQSAQSWANEAVAAGVRLPKCARSLLRDTNWVPRKSSEDTTDVESWQSSGFAPTTRRPRNQSADATVDSAQVGAGMDKRFEGTIKEFVASKFGYITCPELNSVYNRDVFLSNQNNPECFAKGQRVSFKLQFDKTRGFPRAFDLRPLQVN